ncbi:MAG: hypothetical protein HQL73_03425 [Magnetococcales bacterium]|nr:hypothetical protein [Magnetococcales bacterium]
MKPKSYSYTFAASGIHDFLMAGGKIRDAVGASELVEILATGLLDAVREALGLPDLIFSRRGGGAFTVVSEDRESLEKLRDLWSLTVRQVVPGLAFQQGLGEGENATQAITQAMERAERDPNRFQPHVPQAGPLTERNPRTGWPATTLKKYVDAHEFLDPATRAKRHKNFSQGQSLHDRVTPGSTGADAWIWPTMLYVEESQEADLRGKEVHSLPYKGENHYVAAIHADGNGMGSLLKRLKGNVDDVQTDGVELMRDFSEAVTKSVTFAAKKSIEVLTPESVDRVLPGRPVLLGGDDFSMIVRADLALDFTQAFLLAFQKQSRDRLEPLAKKYRNAKLPTEMTASAGIAFFKARQPFHLAFTLAGSLCDHAKKQVRALPNLTIDAPVPSAIAFHRITSSVVYDYETIMESEMIVPGHPPLSLTMQPYGVGEKVEGLPNLSDLIDLMTFLNKKELRSGHARQLLTLLRLNRTEAEKRYRRWRENLDPNLNKKAPKGGILKSLDQYLKNLGCQEPDSFPERTGGRLSTTPLGDVMTLLAMGTGGNDD